MKGWVTTVGKWGARPLGPSERTWNTLQNCPAEKGARWAISPWIPIPHWLRWLLKALIPLRPATLRGPGKFLWPKKVLRQGTQVFEVRALHKWKHCPLKLKVSSGEMRGAPIASAKHVYFIKSHKERQGLCQLNVSESDCITVLLHRHLWSLCHENHFPWRPPGTWIRTRSQNYSNFSFSCRKITEKYCVTNLSASTFKWKIFSN